MKNSSCSGGLGFGPPDPRIKTLPVLIDTEIDLIMQNPSRGTRNRVSQERTLSYTNLDVKRHQERLELNIILTMRGTVEKAREGIREGVSIRVVE